MREIRSEQIADAVSRLCREANVRLPDDVCCALKAARAAEDGALAGSILDTIIRNFETANPLPLCQDTGMACVFLEIGQELHIAGDLAEAVNRGVRRGYAEGYLRKSVVGDPLERVNTGDNTPALLYTELVSGDRLKITVAPKGFGSENMSRLAMLKPSDGVDGVRAFVLEAVRLAGANPCPPVVIGVGLGGSFDKAAYLAKKALLRPIGVPHDKPLYAELEASLLKSVNELGIGPQGFGGKTTALAVQIESLPTHIAGLPCAVNINCHVSRHVTEVL